MVRSKEAMRKQKEDWLITGLQILTEAGKSGLTIERMTALLGVTKGSFYHHFKNMKDFERQLIDHWANQYLSTAADYPQDPDEGLKLLDAIMEEGFGPITDPEAAIRIWAQEDKDVQKIVQQIDAVRRDFVLQIFRPFAPREDEAQLMADMFYAMTIGAITAQPRLSSRRVLEMYQAFKLLFKMDQKVELRDEEK